MSKEKTIPFSTRIKPTLKKVVIDYCDKEGIIVQRFLEDALIRELEARRTEKK
jgi:hypothetical protein